MDGLKSNVTFISNLYPVEKEILHNDIAFCQHIDDPERIFKMKCNPLFYRFNFTKQQEKIYICKAWLHCELNPKHKPFGFIKQPDGLLKEICKCEKKDCKSFLKCKSLKF